MLVLRLVVRTNDDVEGFAKFGGSVKASGSRLFIVRRPGRSLFAALRVAHCWELLSSKGRHLLLGLMMMMSGDWK